MDCGDGAMERMGTAEDSVAAEVMARNEMRKCCMVEDWLMYEYVESNAGTEGNELRLEDGVGACCRDGHGWLR